MSYSSDLTSEQWDLIKEHFDTGNYGKSRKYSQQVLVNAVLYINKTGCQWRSLPTSYPPWKTVYSFYKRAKDRNIWEKAMQSLVKQSRLKLGKGQSPSYSIIDSQSVKTTNYGPERGIDGGKKN